MKVARKYIPLNVRVLVASRQVFEAFPEVNSFGVNLALARCHVRFSYARYLANLLAKLFGPNVGAELHHRPALVNRPWNNRTKDYDPPANDPDHLVYLRKDDHDIETRVRGVGAQRSDLSQRRYNKKVAKNREKRTGNASDTHAKLKRPKRKWASRPFPKGRRLTS